jgi:protein O-mannosyl-transferase
MERKLLYRLLQLILIVPTLLIYLKSVGFEFTNWDDGIYVVNNPIIKNLSPSGLVKMFSSFYGGNFHPLTALSNAIDYQLLGLNPMAYHLGNVLFHILNSLLVFACISLLWPNVWVAFGTALFFAVHPMHVESIAWVSERKDVLYTFFLLLSLYYYLKNKNSVTVLILFLASCLSKPSAIIFPFILILVDYYRNEDFDWKKSMFSKWPFFLLSIVFGIVALYAQNQSGAVQDAEVQTNLILKLVAPCYSIVYYLFKFFVPFQFSAFHPFPKHLNFIHFVCVPLLIGMFWYVYQNRKNKTLIFTCVFFLINLILVIQIIGFGNAIVAERYTYVPYIGLAFGLCVFIEMLALKAKNSNVLPSILVFVGIVFSIISFNRTKVWANSISLFSDVTNKYPESAIGWNNLGNAQMKNGSPTEAISSLNKAIQFNPKYAEAYNNRGAVYIKTKQFAEAQKDLVNAIYLKLDYPEAFYNIGILYYQQGEAQNALEQFNKAIALDKNYQSAYYNKAICLAQLNKIEEAKASLLFALKLNDEDVEAKLLLEKLNKGANTSQILTSSVSNEAENANQNANMLMQSGKTAEAIIEYSKAIEFDGKYSEAYNNRGTAYGKLKEYEKAIKDFSKAIELNDKYDVAFKNRGMAFNKLGKKKEACNDWEMATKLGNVKASELILKNCN